MSDLVDRLQDKNYLRDDFLTFLDSFYSLRACISHEKKYFPKSKCGGFFPRTRSWKGDMAAYLDGYRASVKPYNPDQKGSKPVFYTKTIKNAMAKSDILPAIYAVVSLKKYNVVNDSGEIKSGIITVGDRTFIGELDTGKAIAKDKAVQMVGLVMGELDDWEGFVFLSGLDRNGKKYLRSGNWNFTYQKTGMNLWHLGQTVESIIVDGFKWLYELHTQEMTKGNLSTPLCLPVGLTRRYYADPSYCPLPPVQPSFFEDLTIPAPTLKDPDLKRAVEGYGALLQSYYDHPFTGNQRKCLEFLFGLSQIEILTIEGIYGIGSTFGIAETYDS